MATLGEHFSPNQIAKSRGIDVNKVLGWINSGELRAKNYAKKVGGLPRWKVSSEDLDAFDKLRASRPDPKPARKSRRQLVEPTEYVK